MRPNTPASRESTRAPRTMRILRTVRAASAGQGTPESRDSSKTSGTTTSRPRISRSSPSSRPPAERDQEVLLAAAALHGDAHLLAGLPRSQGVGVVVDVVHSHSVEL